MLRGQHISVMFSGVFEAAGGVGGHLRHATIGYGTAFIFAVTFRLPLAVFLLRSKGGGEGVVC